MSWEDGEVPQGWTLCELGAVATVTGGGTPKTDESENFSEIGGHPWITPSDLTGYADKYISRGRRFLTDRGLKHSSAKYLSANTVLFSSRAPIGHVAIAANAVTTNQGFRSFTPHGELDSSYLYYALKHLTPLAQSWASGTTFPEISGSKAAQLPIAFPDLSTQHRIARLLDTCSDTQRSVLGHLASARRAIQRFRRSVLTAACSGRLTEDWRSRNLVDPAPIDRQENDDPYDIPRTWSWTTPEGARQPDRSITYGVIKLGAVVPDGVPTLRSSDVRSLRIDDSGVKRISLHIADNYKRTYLRGGEVLVTVRGSLGGVATVPKHMAGWNISREVAMLTFNSTVRPDFAAIAIASPQCQSWIGGVLKGVTYTGINIRDLKNLPIPEPSLNEQDEIVRLVDALMIQAHTIEQLIQSAERHASQTSQALLNATLSAGFSGANGGSRIGGDK